MNKTKQKVIPAFTEAPRKSSSDDFCKIVGNASQRSVIFVKLHTLSV